MHYTTSLVLLLLLVFQEQVYCQPVIPDSYNIVWTEQSNNSGESMPLTGGDMGCYVWVEKGEILIYVQRSGSLSENGEYLKMGRIRLQLSPNPFSTETSFRQELKLFDGYIEISSEGSQGEQPVYARIKLWVEIERLSGNAYADHGR